MNILSKAEMWITSQVRACKAMHLALNSLTFFSPQSINHAIDFKMAYYKLAHCLEFNGKIALSPSYLIYTWIIYFLCNGCHCLILHIDLFIYHLSPPLDYLLLLLSRSGMSDSL